MEEHEVELSVMNVYDIASEIGEEFEKIIDNHGTDAVTNLMPKVIYALEHLELFALKNEKESSIIQNLKDRITKLEYEKMEKAEGQERFERELEQIEEHWKTETRDLVAVLAKVQDENKRLRGTLADQKYGDFSDSSSSTNIDVVVLQRLRTLVDNQRDQIRSKEKELTMKLSELESLTTQVDRLTTTGKELRRKHKIVQNQVRNLIDERAEFLAQLQNQQREILVLRQNLGLAEKENEDLTHHSLELNSFDLKNKAIYDLDDPNRPRFTTSELKEILQERNELKAKVSDLEDELELYRPKNSCDLEEDCPVQGPLPYEPEDAPWKKSSESYVRKLRKKKCLHNQKKETKEKVFENYSLKTTSHFLAQARKGAFQRCPKWLCQILLQAKVEPETNFRQMFWIWLNSRWNGLESEILASCEGNLEWFLTM